MKQGSGTDVLGTNDPRSAMIGVIYVSPNDDKGDILAAILLQEKLGRKQVAVVLPPHQNKAFQHPGDFDDLRVIHRKMLVQIIFIAPPGPGPTEFARRRRFLVYSSLESYARALRDEIQIESATKKSWVFGSPRTKVDGTSTPSHGNGNAGRAPTETGLPAAREHDAPANYDEDKHDRNGPVLPFAAGAALGGGTTITANSAFNAPPQGANPATLHDFDDDWDDLGPLPASPVRKPAPEDLYGPTQALPPSPGADTAIDGGSIIELRSRRSSKAPSSLTPREPGPVPSRPVVAPKAGSTTSLPRPRRSTGSTAAAASVGAVAGNPSTRHATSPYPYTITIIAITLIIAANILILIITNPELGHPFSFWLEILIVTITLLVIGVVLFLAHSTQNSRSKSNLIHKSTIGNSQPKATWVARDPQPIMPKATQVARDPQPTVQKTNTEIPGIFVSHSSEDNIFGIKLVNDLRREIGNDSAVWYDSKGGLQGGDTWWDRIKKELKARPIFIVILSPAAISSGWVNDEIRIAWRQKNSSLGKLIIPLTYKACEVPDDLATIQHISFENLAKYEESLQELLQVLGFPTKK